MIRKPRSLRIEVSSPCQRICQLDQAQQTCIGCHRTLDEIRRWSRMLPEEKQRIVNRINQQSTQISRGA